MATKVVNNLAGRGRLQQTANGLTLESESVVLGVTGTGQQRLINALMEPGLPKMFSSHPAEPRAKLVSRSPQDNKDGSVSVRLTYQWDPNASSGGGGEDGYLIIQGGLEVSQVDVDHDRDGNQILLQYAYPASGEANYYPQLPDLAGTTDKQSGSASVDNATRWVRFIRTEYNTSPDTLQQIYGNRISSTTWAAFPADAAGTWRCTGVDYRSRFGGLMWEVTYMFKHRSAGWQPWVRYRRPDGTVPPDLVDGTGRKQVTHYWEANFNNLGFPQIGRNPPKPPSFELRY